MDLNDLLLQPSEWLKGSGPNADIVISSRIRLARNLDKCAFVHWADEKQRKIVFDRLSAACGNCKRLPKKMLFNIDNLDEIDRQFLVERHLMSREHAADGDHKAVCMSNDEVVSIMINEEDHLRIQVMQSGFDLMQAWKVGDMIDNELSGDVNYAFNLKWGYLTACPTNTGTGLRASVMLHLPSLVLTKQIDRVLQAITKLSLTARGLYGEGTEATGNFFQISNQITLGTSEHELINHLTNTIRQVVESEQNARHALLEKELPKLQDRVWRAYGLLKNAHIISSGETLELLSSVRLGVDLGLVPGVGRELINELFMVIQPAHLQKICQEKLSPEQRDIKRAELIRRKLD